MAEQTTNLEPRIARLERTNQRLIVLVAGLALYIIYAAVATPSTSRARAFQLVDEAGVVRAELQLRPQGPGLFVKDERGRDRVAVFHDTSTSGVFVFDSTGTTRIGVAQFAHGGGGFALHGPDSKGAAVLYLKGEGSLRFFSEDGAVTNQVTASGR